jgi:2-haloacid dehalogenase
MAAPLAGARAVVFDAYGTLLDVASAAGQARDVLGDRWQPLSELWRRKQLEYSWLRSLMGRHADFWQVTGDALDHALEALRVAEPGLRQRLMDAYARLDAYPDAVPLLGRLRGRGLRLAILSNGSPRMLAQAARSARIDALLDHVLSVEEVGTYKPHPSVYRLACDRLGAWPAEIAFVSANGWDAWGAKAAGLRVAWCNRSGQPKERLTEPPDAELRSLDELPALLGLEG